MSLSIDVEKIVSVIDPISLAEMDHVKLMRRQDAKFVIPATFVPGLLRDIAPLYRVLEIGGKRIHPYHTIYYDTDGLAMYHEHHNGRLNRYKVRTRTYLTSDIAFIEVKFKNNKKETIKRRIGTVTPEEITGERTGKFLAANSPYTVGEIHPVLENHFKRITLVHKKIPERVTIDVELGYNRPGMNGEVSLPGLSVVEIKYERDSMHSDMISYLRRKSFQSMGFSKYCIGTILNNPHIKSNLFKQRMRRIDKIERTFESINN
ncbi:MAG: polyphosphate polymerase domain-containing protein [Bacteroidales bacterium]|nr:polyphosphate polymerase domain-containing protein [Bacteroidales bacterium]